MPVVFLKSVSAVLVIHTFLVILRNLFLSISFVLQPLVHDDESGVGHAVVILKKSWPAEKNR